MLLFVIAGESSWSLPAQAQRLVNPEMAKDAVGCRYKRNREDYTYRNQFDWDLFESSEALRDRVAWSACQYASIVLYVA